MSFIKKLSEIFEDESSYVYHGTWIGSALKIQKEGLKGDVNIKNSPVFLSTDELYAKSYADRKGGNKERSVLLRTPKTPQMIKDTSSMMGSESNYDVMSYQSIPPNMLEVKTPFGWIPIEQWDFIDKKII